MTAKYSFAMCSSPWTGSLFFLLNDSHPRFSNGFTIVACPLRTVHFTTISLCFWVSFGELSLMFNFVSIAKSWWPYHLLSEICATLCTLTSGVPILICGAVGYECWCWGGEHLFNFPCASRHISVLQGFHLLPTRTGRRQTLQVLIRHAKVQEETNEAYHPCQVRVSWIVLSSRSYWEQWKRN